MIKKLILIFVTLQLFISVFAYKIGDVITKPDGSKGVVFWISPNREGGWMVALDDAPGIYVWGNDTVDVPTLVNAPEELAYSDTTGYANTKKIRDYFPGESSYAANAVDFANGWYLPTLTQLNALATAYPVISSKIISSGGSAMDAYDYYWSSTESGQGTAFSIGASYGDIWDDPKEGYIQLVRAISSFTSESFSYDTTLTYLWSTGDTVASIRQVPIVTTTYSVIATTQAGCTDYKETTVFVAENQSDTIYATICQGEKYTDNGFNDSITGIYDRIESFDVCSMTVVLDLTVLPVKNTILKDTTCIRKAYSKNGFYIDHIDSIGDFSYSQVYLTSFGCDSTVELQLHVLPQTKTVIIDSICQGQPYNQNGFNIPDLKILGWKTFEQTYSSLSGPCDSVVELHLLVNPASFSVSNATICEGDSIVFNEVVYSEEGIYAAYLTNALGCDSIATFKLTVSETSDSIINYSICEGESYVFNGKTYNKTGNYSDTLINILGCDSIASLELLVNQNTSSIYYETICKGDSISFNGSFYSIAGTYQAQLTNAKLCDSIAGLVLAVSNPASTYIYETIVDGDSFYFNDDYLTIEGIYVDTLQSYYNCDSIVILQISVIKNVVVPDIFSPNKDGANDVLIIKNLHQYPNNKILIFNRWGNKVWEAGPYLNDWDGTNQFGVTVGGENLPVGTYFYILELGDGSEAYKGYIYLNR